MNTTRRLLSKNPYNPWDFVKNSVYELPLLNIFKPLLSWHKGYIAGGCFKNLFNSERIKDVDIFFECEEDLKDALKYIKNHREQFKRVYSNDKCVSYRHVESNIRLELVTHMFMSPIDLIGGVFDFTIVKFALSLTTEMSDEEKKGLSEESLTHHQKLNEKIEDAQVQKRSEDKDLDFLLRSEDKEQSKKKDHVGFLHCIYHKDFFEDLVCRRLDITSPDILYLPSTLSRIYRYIGYGYNPTENVQRMISKTISKLTPEEISDIKNNIYEGFYGAID